MEQQHGDNRNENWAETVTDEYNSNPLSHVVVGGRFRFNPQRDALSDLDNPDVEVRLQPTAARILHVMLQCPGEIISRKDLFQRGWGQYGFVVSEGSLNQAIHLLRDAFAQLDPGHAYIKTLPRIGYCLIAQVQTRQATMEARSRASGAFVPRPATERAGSHAPFGEMLALAPS